MKTIDELFIDQDVYLSDGATGTNLQQRGLPIGIPAERWVLENTYEIKRLHEDFIEAGSDIILTCTFGGSSIRLSHNCLEKNAREINLKAAEIAQQARGNKNILIAGSIGPLGQMLKPYGALETSDAYDNYANQALFLFEGGVDFLLIETQFDIEEAKIAVQAANSVTKLPIICSFSYDRGTKTMMGASPKTMAETFKNTNLVALGINCGKSLEDNYEALVELRDSTSVPIWFKPNAGLPEMNSDGVPSYSLTPIAMGASAKSWVDAGAKFIGGCCGTSPEHIRAIANAIKNK